MSIIQFAVDRKTTINPARKASMFSNSFFGCKADVGICTRAVQIKSGCVRYYWIDIDYTRRYVRYHPDTNPDLFLDKRRPMKDFCEHVVSVKTASVATSVFTG